MNNSGSISFGLKKLQESVKSSDSISFSNLFKKIEFSDKWFLILLLSFPSSIPIPLPPLASTFIIIPFLFVVVQKFISPRRNIWLPKFISKRIFSTTSVSYAIDVALKYVCKMEKISKERLLFLCNNPKFDRFFLLLVIILSLCVAIPLPLTNYLPSLSVTILSFGLASKDGLIALVGIILGIISTVITIIIVILTFVAINYAKSHI